MSVCVLGGHPDGRPGAVPEDREGRPDPDIRLLRPSQGAEVQRDGPRGQGRRTEGQEVHH